MPPFIKFGEDMVKRLYLLALVPICLLFSCSHNQDDTDSSKLSFSINYDSDKGTIEGTKVGKYEKDTLIVLSATAKEKYRFDGYYVNEVKNENLVSTNANYEFNLVDDISLYANFVESSSDITLSSEKEVAIYTIKPGEGSIPKTTYELKSLADYYKKIDFSLTKNDLRKELQKVSKIKTKRDYNFARQGLQYTDESIAKPGTLFGIYDGYELPPTWDSGKTWNREHLWCQSRYKGVGSEESTCKSDLHNLRAAYSKSNGSRGNKYYDEATNSEAYYPNETSKFDFRGDVAREIFYMYTTYDGLKLTNTPNSELNISMGKLDALLKWHEEDKVDEFERQRNMKIYQYQGNRNPYIDIPELVSKVF